MNQTTKTKPSRDRQGALTARPGGRTSHIAPCISACAAAAALAWSSVGASATTESNPDAAIPHEQVLPMIESVDPAEPYGPAEAVTIEATMAVSIHAEVRLPSGNPAAGAVVVTSAGGRGVTDADGIARFSVDVDPRAESMHITAIATVDGMNHVGSKSVPVVNAMPVPQSAHSQLRSAVSKLDAGVIPLSADDECEPHWLPMFGGHPGTGGSVFAMTVFDDGNGPALYVAGQFLHPSGTIARNIARWDGTTWTSLASAPFAANSIIHAMAAFDDGSGPALYVGGTFSSIGSIDAKYIARWDGSEWSPVGGGTNSAVRALATFDDGNGTALYVGGSFTMAGSQPASRIARWDGSSWSPVGAGLNDAVRDLLVVDVAGPGPRGAAPLTGLYAVGNFTQSGEVWLNRIGRWDGEQWSPVGAGAGMNDVARSMTMFDDGSGPALYVGGAFSSVDGVPAANIARWDGHQWSTPGSGMTGEFPVVMSMTVFDDGSGDALYAGGRFDTVDGTIANHIARWDGDQWTTLEGGIGTSSSEVVYALNVYDAGDGPSLYVGGSFWAAGGMVGHRGLVRWDGEQWRATPHDGIAGPVSATAIYDDGTGPALYVAGGLWDHFKGEFVGNIFRWDGEEWSDVGDGVSSTIVDLAVFDDGTGPALYATGFFTAAGGSPANRIARWDGASWSALGDGLNGTGRAMTVFDDGTGPALYVTGEFTIAGGVSANYVAKWDGSNWSSLGNGLGNVGMSLGEFDDGSGSGLYVGGFFTTAGDASANRIARWDGESWSAMGSGANGTVYAIRAFDDGEGPALYVGGIFSQMDGMLSRYIARWDGESWSPVGAAESLTAAVRSILVFDDGSGPALFVGGRFGFADGEPAHGFARWDGVSWTALGEGIATQAPTGDRITHLTGVSEGILKGDAASAAIYISGPFSASPAGDSYLTRWVTCPPDSECDFADLNCDGVVDGADVLILLAAWGKCDDTDDCPADLSGDGVVDGTDLLILLANWG